MSKFFVQMLLSAMVGVSAALGFSPDARSELREANAYLRERVDVVLENVHDLASGLDAAISSKTTARVSAENGDAAEVKVTNTLNVKSGTEGSLLDSWFPALSLGSSFSSKTQSNMETDGSSLDVGLKEKINSALNLGLEE